MRRGEVFYSLTSSLLVSLRLWTVNFTSVSQLFFLPLGWTECLNMGWGWVFPFRAQVGSDNVSVLVAQLCLALCNPMEYSPPGSSVHGIFEASVPEWVVISSSRGPSGPRDQTGVSCIAGRLLSPDKTLAD